LKPFEVLDTNAFYLEFYISMQCIHCSRLQTFFRSTIADCLIRWIQMGLLVEAQSVEFQHVQAKWRLCRLDLQFVCDSHVSKSLVLKILAMKTKAF
jgi:hypothetical protein